MNDEEKSENLYDKFISDIRNSGWLLEKIKASDSYTQNLYAAICNNELIRNDVFDILVNNRISFSWRAIAGILSNIRNNGDYMEYYCSGSLIDGSPDYVQESFVTDEILQDLKKLGWNIVPYDDAL